MKEFELSEQLKEIGILVRRRENPKAILREFYSPCCATLLSTETSLEGEPILFDLKPKVLMGG